MSSKTISFNQLRDIKHNLPAGSTQKIADDLGISVDKVRNYFGASHTEGGDSGIHIEPGPGGGIVILDDTTILEKAIAIIESAKS